MRTTPIRYAVVGIGHISQIAVLPVFAHARPGSRLVALVSGDEAKRRVLSKRYQVPAYTYEDYSKLLHSGNLDAVYIAEPNDLHARFTIRAAKAGIHVLCEKPLAVTEKETQTMIQAARQNNVFLMTAYRLHFEQMNLTAIQIAQSGTLGELRFFNSTFSLLAKPGDIRLQAERGGGSVYDLGIYCINAARHLFRDEPLEVIAASAQSNDPRFKGVDEMTSVILRFPKDRLASFTSSLGADDTGSFSLVGTKGSLRADPAYEYASGLNLYLTRQGKTQKKVYPQRDQFAAELIHFSDRIRQHRAPEPSGEEGQIDVRIIEAIYESAKTRRWVSLKNPRFNRSVQPSLRHEIHRPKVQKPDLVNATSASGKD